MDIDAYRKSLARLAGRPVVAASRIQNATKKGVFRLTFDGGATAILYAWDPAENYWPQQHDVGPADPFADAAGADLFEASYGRLTRLGVGTPQVYELDRSRTRSPYDVALVEDVPGNDLETLLQRDPAAAEPTLAALGAALADLHACRSPHLGKVALVDTGTAPQERNCVQVVVDRARNQLAEAAAGVSRIAAARAEVAAAVDALAAAVSPRTEYRLIHGELDPGHVLVGADGRPLLIDIEGMMFFDVEWEHVFLRFRLGDHYRWLEPAGLDQQRLALYQLALHLSLVAGPLRILDSDHPERDFLTHIVEFNIDRVLAFLG